MLDRLTKIYNKYFNVGLERNDRKNRVVTHTLRHTFASHLAIKTPIYTIQKLMNHKDITMIIKIC
ncbi:tyrosine-type recombinase/integrase [Aliarcobacter butzleri]|uniref:tyrosine-type recombinase/integrase n=1 Tax=Aliarcobacter butzleri TaxID=28197 RepID=UPI0012FA700E